MKNIKTYREVISESILLEGQMGMDKRDILFCMSNVQTLAEYMYTGSDDLEILGKPFFLLRTVYGWGEDKLSRGLGPEYPNLYKHSISFGAEFPLGDVSIDVTPFRDGKEELRPAIFINDTQLHTPESSVITDGLDAFLKGDTLANRNVQGSIITRGVRNAKSVLDNHIKEEISMNPDGDDLYLFEDIKELMDYFMGELDWIPRGELRNKIMRIVRVKHIFGK